MRFEFVLDQWLFEHQSSMGQYLLDTVSAGIHFVHTSRLVTVLLEVSHHYHVRVAENNIRYNLRHLCQKPPENFVGNSVGKI